MYCDSERFLSKMIQFKNFNALHFYYWKDVLSEMKYSRYHQYLSKIKEKQIII